MHAFGGTVYSEIRNNLYYRIYLSLGLKAYFRVHSAEDTMIRSFFSVTTKIDYDKIKDEKSYGRIEAYAQSKLANILFSRELSRRLQGTCQHYKPKNI